MEYENRVVAFIDILGFKELIINSVDNNDKSIPDKIKLISQAYTAIDMILNPEDLGFQNKPERNVSIFSDAIAVSFKIEETSQVSDTLDDIKYIIMTLVEMGIMCRGGVAMGNLLHTDKYIFGPALVEAYTLESEVAVYPRVILDRDIVDAGINAHSEVYSREKEEEYIKSLILQDGDGMYYVDYFFKAASDTLEFGSGDFETYIEKLGNIIRKGLMASSHHSKTKLRGKYYWMREKYNNMVDTVKTKEAKKYFEELGEFELANFYGSLKKISPQRSKK